MINYNILGLSISLFERFERTHTKMKITTTTTPQECKILTDDFEIEF